MFGFASSLKEGAVGTQRSGCLSDTTFRTFRLLLGFEAYFYSSDFMATLTGDGGGHGNSLFSHTGQFTSSLHPTQQSCP